VILSLIGARQRRSTRPQVSPDRSVLSLRWASSPTACARCGSFQDALTGRSPERPLCNECLGRLTASATLYSAQSATAVRVLLNRAAAAVNAGPELRRLENRGQARAFGVAAAALAAG